MNNSEKKIRERKKKNKQQTWRKYFHNTYLIKDCIQNIQKNS